MWSLICFHCQKKGHYAQNCCTRRHAIKNISTPSTAPVIPVTPANRFSILEEEMCLSTTTVVSVLVPKLLDAKEIKKRTFDVHKIREITMKIQKLPISECIRLVEHLKPKPRPKFSAEQIEATLPEIVKTYTDEQKLKLLHQALPEGDIGTEKHMALIKAMNIQGAILGQYMTVKNFVRIQFPLLHYRGQAEEGALLDSGATENFIDADTVKRLWLGTTKLNLQRPVYNVDGTENKHGTITHACDLLVKQGNKKERLQFYVSNLGKDRFIFGYPWFRKFNPDIDWENAKLRGPQVKVETI